MKLHELKDWVNSLPDKFLEYNVVNGEVGFLATDAPEDDFTYRIDKPIVALVVDEETEEVVIMNDPPNPFETDYEPTKEDHGGEGTTEEV